MTWDMRREWESRKTRQQFTHQVDHQVNEIECSMFTQITFFSFSHFARCCLLWIFFATSSDVVVMRCSCDDDDWRRCHCAVQLSIANDYDVIRVNKHVWNDDYATFFLFLFFLTWDSKDSNNDHLKRSFFSSEKKF